MKKIFTLLCLLALYALPAHAQVIFQEDFDVVGGLTAGGAGTYTFPAGWLLRNVDNRAPAGAVAYVNEAWERREDFAFNVADSAAFSTSWYGSPGAADDWMWTPPIAIPGTGGVMRLSWNAVTYDPSFRDGYEVRVMAEPNVPTGGAGDLGNQVSASTVVFSTPAENNSWTRREVDLSSYAGQTIRIAYRNVSNDKFLLLIDDVLVERVLDFDAALVNPSKTIFPKVPVSQNRPHLFSGRISNQGTNAFTGAYIKATVYNSDNVEVFSAQSAPANVGSLTTSDTLSTTTPFVADVAGKYTVRIKTMLSGVTDQRPSNDEYVDSLEITQTVFARDNGLVNGALGIGNTTPGYLGTIYPIYSATELSSLSAYLVNTVLPGNTMSIGATVMKFENGMPGTVLFDAPARTLGSTDASKWHDFRISPTLNVLPGDTIFVSLKEIDSTLSIGQATGIFVPRTNFVDWPTNTIPGWGAVEAYGAGYAKQFMIRANFECVTDPASTLVAPGNTTVISFQPYTDTRYYYANNCTVLVAKVTGDDAISAISGNTTAKVWVDADQPAHFVKRHYEITPQTNAETATGEVTLYFTQAEFNAFNAVNSLALPTGPSDAAGIANLKIEKRGGASGDGTGLPDTYSGATVTIDPADENIVWNPDAERWEVTFSVSGFSGFFVKTQSEPLPLRLVNFSGKREKSINHLSWQTAQEENVSHFQIERSTDAKAFATIHTMPARNGASQQYGYSDAYNNEGKVYYRLKMVDLDKTFAYSRIIALDGTSGMPITLFPNPVKTTVKLDVTDPDLLGTTATLIDIQGNTRKHFNITQQTQELNVQPLSTGTYWIRLHDGRAFKFVKE
jgi:hypothetical protein